jgi:hypothetical protein
MLEYGNHPCTKSIAKKHPVIANRLAKARFTKSLVDNSVYSFSFEGEGIGRNQKELKELQIFPIPYCNFVKSYVGDDS